MRQFLQTWCLIVTKLEPKLVQFVIPTKTTGFLSKKNRLIILN
jgi:hypothetical protein